MSGIKYALAMLAAGGAMGAASESDAATLVNLNIQDGDFVTPITLAGGASPQFYYGFSEGSLKTTLSAAGTSRLGIDSSTPGLPGAGETFTRISQDTAKPGQYGLVPYDSNDHYIHLTFDANGVNYLGTAHVDGNATLDSITYQAAAGVPEPAEWALLLGGFGLAGAAVRQNRRRQAATA